jgi:histidine ammonia-lyase
MNKSYTLQEAVELIAKPVSLGSETRATMQKSVDFLKRYMDQATAPVYGVNTGFGSLQNVVVSNEQLSQLQENLLITHAAGVGEALKPQLVANMMWLKLVNMSKGHSAVRPIIFERLAFMLNEKVYPVVTAQGSLGASGDLAPLSQMVLPLIGKGYVWVNEQKVAAKDWLTSVQLEPITLWPKEALALINGT